MSTAHNLLTLLDTELSGEDFDDLDYVDLRRLASLAHHWAEIARAKLDRRRAPVGGLHEEESE